MSSAAASSNRPKGAGGRGRFYEAKLQAVRRLTHTRLLQQHPYLRHPATHVQFLIALPVPEDPTEAFTLHVGDLSAQWPEHARYIYFFTHPADLARVRTATCLVGRADLTKQDFCPARYLKPVLCEGRANLRHPYWSYNTLHQPSAYEPGPWEWFTNETRPTQRESNILALEEALRRRLRVLQLFDAQPGGITDYRDYAVSTRRHSVQDVMSLRMFTLAARDKPVGKSKAHVMAFWAKWAAAERKLAWRRVVMHYWKRLRRGVEMALGHALAPATLQDFDARHAPAGATQQVRGWYRVPFEKALHLVSSRACPMHKGFVIAHHSMLLTILLEQWSLLDRPTPWTEVQLLEPIAWNIPEEHSALWEFQYGDVVLPRLGELYQLFRVHTKAQNAFDYRLPRCLQLIEQKRPHLKFQQRQVYGKTMAALRHTGTFPRNYQELVTSWAPRHAELYQHRKTDLAAIVGQWKSIYSRVQTKGASCGAFIACGLCPYTRQAAGEAEETATVKRCALGPFWRGHPAAHRLNRPEARTVVSVGRFLAEVRKDTSV